MMGSPMMHPTMTTIPPAGPYQSQLANNAVAVERMKEQTAYANKQFEAQYAQASRDIGYGADPAAVAPAGQQDSPEWKKYYEELAQYEKDLAEYNQQQGVSQAAPQPQAAPMGAPMMGAPMMGAPMMGAPYGGGMTNGLPF
mmetsp:Transcript_17263/g.43616  ORF Transcript_17263/g.43616 Transcript_17263/m.43616 type:complete len:141 (+) Transcript_17263:1-423(+)